MSAAPRPAVVHLTLSLASSRAPAIVPAMIPAIISHSRRRIDAKLGPENSCQTLVMKEGTISSEAAATGGMTVPSRPMASVGRPIPAMPLTIPASRKVIAMIPVDIREESDILP